MDGHEYTLSESARLLARAGVRYVFLGQHVDIPRQFQSQVPVDEHGDMLFHGKQMAIRTVWTYVGLAQDLALPTPPERLLMLQKIQSSTSKHLGWGEEDLHICSIDEGAETGGQVVQTLSPKVVLCFSDQPETLKPTGMPPSWTNSQIVFLPGLEAMVQGGQQEKNKTWQILKSLRNS